MWGYTPVRITGVLVIFVTADCVSIEEDFITWKDKFWPSMCKKFGIATVGEDIWYVSIFYAPRLKTFGVRGILYSGVSIHESVCQSVHPLSLIHI